jgi:acetyl/propionyl-CoA carboxylase alpha subunit
VEVQVLGDQHGNLAHIFERECSSQRRHQKIIEESPSLLLDADLRAEMGAAAVAAAKAVAYSNAGTVEFLVDPANKDFYFLEMNTRLQVEHPVTELVTGLDLVQLQLRIAAGETLPFRQTELQQSGHAIECRIYAEDPAAGFLPQAGEVLKLDWPQGEGIRVDSGIREGQAVTSHYDPMLAKLIVWAADRPAAIARMRAGLAETVLLGLTSNLEFLQAVITSQAFADGAIDTAYVDRELADWTPQPLSLEALAAAARVDAGPPPDQDELGHDPYLPWARLDGFRIGGGQ